MDSRLPKDLVLCLDGTGNEFGNSNSNVVKIYQTLAQAERQVCYYHPGLGTRGDPNALSRLAKLWTKWLGLAFGYGLSRDLADAYSFVMAEYEPGDRLFVFGFSRGAYTARALCGMLHLFGLLRRHQEVLIDYMIRMLHKRIDKEGFQIVGRFRETFCRRCPIHFLGIWDTVGSFGPWMSGSTNIPFTSGNPEIRIARQAISIDERRAFYRQNLLRGDLVGQDCLQVWFAGTHSDVGGSYPESESGLSKIALKWMLDEARAAGLSVDEAKVARVLGETDPAYTRPDAAAKLHISLRCLWWALEFLPKLRFVRQPDGIWTRRWGLPMARPRVVPADAVIHASVEERRKRVPDYRPVNLPPGTAVHRPASAKWGLAGILAVAAAAVVIYLRFVH
jgi:uncharacterized protein (DUF2235 family)